MKHWDGTACIIMRPSYGAACGVPAEGTKAAAAAPVAVSAAPFAGCTANALTTGYGPASDHVVVGGGGRQYDIAACHRFDTCQAPVVFAASGQRARPLTASTAAPGYAPRCSG